MIAWILLALQAAPDEAACLSFARKMEESIAKDDGSMADQLFDREALMDRTFKDTPGDEKNKAAFRRGILKSFQLGVAVSKQVREHDGSYKFLRLRTQAGSRRALFRMITDDAFNYHDFILEAGPDGSVRATDVHVMLSGEWMSETFRRAYLGFIASQPGLLGKLTGRQNEYVKTMVGIQSMTRLKQQGKPAEALKDYETLSPEGKKDKMALLVRYQSAVDAAPETLTKVLEEFEKAFPGDACLPAISIDAHTVAKRWDKALAAIEIVDQSIGGDPYLQILRAGLHLEAGSLDRAKDAVTKALEQEKGIPQGYWMMVTISLREQKYAETVKWLNALEKDLGLVIGDISNSEIYAGFVKSPEYREWQKGRKK